MMINTLSPSDYITTQEIIAREYWVPAVVATGNATSVLRDGQQIRVDGNTGSGELLS